MSDWYHVYLGCILLLWAASSPRDRSALRIVLIAALASEVIADEITSHISGASKLAIPGLIEIVTILALLKWAANKTGITQAGLLVFAWLAHFLCYVDVILKTDFVYSRYESILLWVSVGQLIAFHDTMRFNIIRLRSAVVAWADRAFSIPNPSFNPYLSLVSIDKKVSPTEIMGDEKHSTTLGDSQ